MQACWRSRMTPSTPEQVTRLLARGGDRVQAGEVLLELWHQDLLAEKNLAEHEIRISEHRSKGACLRAETAKREARRIGELKNRKFAAEEQVDQATTQALASAQDCLAAKTSIESARARLAIIAAGIDRAILKVPFAGTVAEVNTELEEFITPSPTGILTLPAVDLIDTTCLYVSAPIDEVDAPAVQVGMSAKIRLDAFPGKTFAAQVRRTAPYVLDLEKQARTVEVEAELWIDEATVTLLPGYSADLEALLQQRDQTLVVPAESIRAENQVLLYQPESKTLTLRTIRTGIANWKQVEVLDGLQPGDRILPNATRRELGEGSKISDTSGH